MRVSSRSKRPGGTPGAFGSRGRWRDYLIDVGLECKTAHGGTWTGFLEPRPHVRGEVKGRVVVVGPVHQTKVAPVDGAVVLLEAAVQVGEEWQTCERGRGYGAAECVRGVLAMVGAA